MRSKDRQTWQFDVLPAVLAVGRDALDSQLNVRYDRSNFEWHELELNCGELIMKAVLVDYGHDAHTSKSKASLEAQVKGLTETSHP